MNENLHKSQFYGMTGTLTKSMKHLLQGILNRQIDDFQSMTNFYEFYDVTIALKREEIKNCEKNWIYEDSVSVQDAGRWTSDAEFGRIILNGPNFPLIKLCKELPDNFPVTTEMVGHLLCRGLSFDQEMQVINQWDYSLQLWFKVTLNTTSFIC